MLSTSNELGSAVAGGLLFLLQPPLPPILLDPEDLRHLVGLYRFPNDIPPVSPDRVVGYALVYRPVARELFMRSWIEDGFGVLQESAAPILSSEAHLLDDTGRVIAAATPSVDPAGSAYMDFTFEVALSLSHAYKVRVWFRDGVNTHYRDIRFSVTR